MGFGPSSSEGCRHRSPGLLKGLREERKSRERKTECWERAARSGAVCTGLDVSSACLFLLHEQLCQKESQAAEHSTAPSQNAWGPL